MPVLKDGSLLDITFNLASDFLAATIQAPLYLAADKVFGVTVDQMNRRLRDALIEHLGGSQTALFLAKDALRKGADPNTLSGRFRNEPIIVAATRYHLPEFVKALKDAGADTSEAYFEAKRKGFIDIFMILRNGLVPL